MLTDQSISRRAVRLRRSIVLEALTLALAATAACNLPPLPSEWHSASVSADGSKVGLVGDGAILIDGTNGQVLRDFDGTFGRSFATPGGDVVAFGPPGALWLTKEKRAEGVELKPSDLGMLDDTTYLGSSRSVRDPKKTTQRFDGPLMKTHSA